MALLSANCIICERTLRETDSVISAIRVVDVFRTQVSAEIPVERQVVPMNVVAIIRLSSDDDTLHTVELAIIRPDGETTPNTLASNVVAPPGTNPDYPRVLFVIGALGVTPRQFGLHHIVIYLDGAEVARTQFTLEEMPEVPTPNSETLPN